jgi:uncharacterized protein (TIRG00374 family)
MSATISQFHPCHIPRLDVKWLRRLLPLALLGLAVHLLLPQLTNFASTWQTVEQMRWEWVAVAVLLEFASYFGSGVLLQGLVKLGGGRLRIVRGMEITLASGGIGLVAAGIVGSTAATYGWIHRTGDDGQGAGLAASLKPVFNNALLLVVAVFGSIHLLLLGDLSNTEMIGFAIMLIVLALVSGTMIWGASHPDGLQRRLSSARRRWAVLRRRASVEHGAAIDERSSHDVNKLQNAWLLLRSGGWHEPLLGATINVVFDAAALYVLFIAAGDRIGIAALLTGYSVATLLGKAAFLPGGVGVVEATMLAIFTTLGAVHSPAIVAVLGYRLISFWIPAAFGLPLAAALQRATRRPVAP